MKAQNNGLWSVVSAVVMAVVMLVGLTVSAAESLGTVTVNDRVGNGWHMASVVSVDEHGLIQGATTLSNYNNFLGFTGGLFVVVVDAASQPIFTTDVRKWGVNSAFFKKKVERTATWSEQIPADKLAKAASIAVVQQHTPTYRVWVWIYENRDLIIAKAKEFVALFQKIQNKELTDADIFAAVDDVAEILSKTQSDNWVVQHFGQMYQIAKDVYALAKQKENGWVPANYLEMKKLVEQIVALSKEEWQWDNADDMLDIVAAMTALVGDENGWKPDNLDDLQKIIEEFYVLVKDEQIPDEVKTLLAATIKLLEK